MEVLPHEEAERLIKEILQYGEVVPSNHAREQMRRRGYETPDIQYILEHGTIIKTEEEDSGYHKYHVKGFDIEGHPGIIVTAIINAFRIIIITVLGGVDEK